MTSKKYIIQPLSLPPPTRHSQNGSRTIALLAKNSKSLHALGPSDVKKRDKESNPSLPCSIGTSDQHKDLDHKKAPERPSESDLKDQPPPDLATDLKDYRNYLKNEKNVTPGFVTPFQNVSTNTGTTNGDDEQEQEKNQDTNNGDFSAWIREMNTKLITKKRQIRTEKKRAEREKQSESTLSASPTSSPSFPKKQKSSLFQIRKKKTKKEGEYDTLSAPTRRETTMPPIRTATDDGTKTHKTQFCKPTPTGNYTNTNTGNTTHKSSKSSDLRLFQIVRPKTDVVDEEKPNSPRNYSSRTPVSAFDDDDSSSSSSSSPSVISKLLTGKSKSFSFMKSSPRSPRTLAPSHHSEHDMRAKRLPRNVVSVSISS